MPFKEGKPQQSKNQPLVSTEGARLFTSAFCTSFCYYSNMLAVHYKIGQEPYFIPSNPMNTRASPDIPNPSLLLSSYKAIKQ